MNFQLPMTSTKESASAPRREDFNERLVNVDERRMLMGVAYALLLQLIDDIGLILIHPPTRQFCGRPNTRVLADPSAGT